MDLNAVATHDGSIVELQGTAEGEPIPRADMDAMIDLALLGTDALCKLQRDTLSKAGVKLERLLR